MTDATAPEPPADTERGDEAPTWDHVSFASLTLAVIALVFAAITWAGWFATGSLTTFALTYGGLPLLVKFVLGAVWFVMLPVSVLALVYGRLGLRRARDSIRLRPDMARAGIALGAVALAVAVAGAVYFSLSFGGGGVLVPEHLAPTSPPVPK